MALAIVAIGLIAGLSVVGPRLGVAPQIILVVAGAALSYLPQAGRLVLGPNIVMEGLLPLLLYASSLALPTIEFRRDLAAIGGLSIVLVIVTAIGLGFVAHWLVPGSISVPLGVTLGALISPTDAAATGVVKRLGLSPRLLAILDGESLLNDASALVVVRTAAPAAIAVVAAGGYSVWKVGGDFIWAMLAAVVIGVVVGRLGVVARQHIPSPATASVISLLIPFCAYLPADLAGASGLVAVVAAGITTRLMTPGRLSATQRMTENANWHTAEFLAEGAVFLIMGLQLKDLITAVNISQETFKTTLLLALVTWLAALVIRAGFVSGVVGWSNRAAARKHDRRERARRYAKEHPEAAHERFGQMHEMMRRYSADVDYLIHEPLHAREGTMLTWAGLRGVVTVAGAQSLPLALPHRPLIVLTAFVVAAGSLLLQGLTLAPLAKGLRLTGNESAPAGDAARLDAELAQAALDILDNPDLKRLDGGTYDPGLLARFKIRLSTPLDEETDDKSRHAQLAELRLRSIAAQRAALIRIHAVGAYPTATLQHALNRLDADEISVNLDMDQ